jgi:hypothetical protein
VRPLAIERFDVRDGHVVAVDEVVTRADIVVAARRRNRLGRGGRRRLRRRGLRRCAAAPGGVVLRGDPERGLAKVATVSEGAGELVVDDAAVWLVGFDRDDEPATILRLGPEDAEPVLVQEVGRREPDPLTVVGGQVISLDSEWLGVDLPPLAEDTTVEGTVVWFRHRTRPTIVGLDVEQATVPEVPLDLDTAPFVPTPAAPSGLDRDRYEAVQCDSLREAFFGGWVAEDGAQRPYIDGVTFESVEIRGSFPDTVIVALFRSEDRPGIRFGRCWRLYDELGNPEDESLEYADVGLMEDVESGDGLPQTDACAPDAEGIVWFDGGWQDDGSWR